MEVPVYDRAKLGRDAELEGPAVITQLDATSLILPGQTAQLEKFGSIIVKERQT